MMPAMSQSLLGVLSRVLRRALSRTPRGAPKTMLMRVTTASAFRTAGFVATSEALAQYCSVPCPQITPISGPSKKPFLVILSAVLAEALSGAKGKNLRNVDSTRVRRPFTSFRFTWARFFDSPISTDFPAWVRNRILREHQDGVCASARNPDSGARICGIRGLQAYQFSVFSTEAAGVTVPRTKDEVQRTKWTGATGLLPLSFVLTTLSFFAGRFDSWL